MTDHKAIDRVIQILANHPSSDEFSSGLMSDEDRHLCIRALVRLDRETTLNELTKIAYRNALINGKWDEPYEKMKLEIVREGCRKLDMKEEDVVATGILSYTDIAGYLGIDLEKAIKDYLEKEG